MLLDRIHVADSYPSSFSEAVNVKFHRIIMQYLWNRGMKDAASIEHFLNKTAPYDTSPLLLKDARKAALKLWEAVDDHQPVLVFGDYDADGVTASALMTEFLKAVGANVNWFIPSRSDGYGMSTDSMKEALEAFPQTKLIVTVDNGIKSGQVVKILKQQGIDVIVTDHHLVGDDKIDFPSDADAVINPQQVDCPYPETMICGCAVAYKLAHAMILTADDTRHNLKAIIGGEHPELFHESFLDLVAIGTVADMMPLTAFENRGFVKRGIDLMTDGNRYGLDALFDLDSYISRDEITAETIGFSIAPQINAASRVDHPRWAMYLLQASSKSDAMPWALKVSELNTTRKKIQEDIARQVEEQLKSDEMLSIVSDMPVIIQKIDYCPHGIIGLVAGDLARRYSRPAIVMTRKDTDWVASARSINGFSITEALSQCSDLLLSHGGHAMSAGLKVSNDNLDAFIHRLTQLATPYIGTFGKKPVMADIEIGLHDIDDELYQIVSFLEPMAGQDCPLITFASRNITVVSCVAFSNRKHLKLNVTDGKGNGYTAIWWKMGHLMGEIPDTVDMIYRIGKETYGGKKGLRLVIESVTASEK